jgi:hypothetical protein
MRSFPAVPLPSAGWLARTLVLALALAACRRDGGDTASPPGSPAQDAQTLASSGRRAPPDCEGPPPAITRDTLEGSWANFQLWLTAHGVQFSDSTMDSTVAHVQLSPKARADSMAISSEFRTPCLEKDRLDSMRIAGVYELRDSVTVPEWGHTFQNGDRIYVFAGGRDTTTATLAYRLGENVALAPDTAWAFRYCPERGQGRRKPQGRWRDSLNKPHGNGPREDPGPGPGTYGWIACASGCCQFYIPPQPIGDDDGLPGNRVFPPCPEKH